MATQLRIDPRPSKTLHLQMRKGREVYIFRFDRETIRCLLDRLEVYAADERLSFNWDDFYLFRGILLQMEARKQC